MLVITYVETFKTDIVFIGNIIVCWSSHGHDRMVVGFKTTYAIGAYHH